MIKIKKDKFIFNYRGLSLVEVLLSIIILGIVISIVTMMTIQTFNIVGTSSNRLSSSQLADLALAKIEKHLQTAVKNNSNDFGKNKVKWKFTGYSDDGKKEKYIIELKNNNLYLKISDKPKEQILENVKAFFISETNTEGAFKISLKLTDESNKVEKDLLVISRNY